jgi:RAB protein geranylgeranyltransferase component A
MLKSEASKYVEFNSVDASFVGDGNGNGKLWNVPDSRAAIIKDKSLTLMEKNQLMRFFKLVMGMEMGMRMMRGREGEDFRGGFGEAVC